MTLAAQNDPCEPARVENISRLSANWAGGVGAAAVGV